MAQTNPGFEVIEGGGDAPKQDPNAIAVALISIGIKTLSQRALTALMDLFCLITCSGVFVIWYLTPSPTMLQIIHNSIFGAFVLAANWIVRTRK
jgi:hypothetical protein